MSDPGLAVQGWLVQTLQADADLAFAMGGAVRIFDAIPPEPTFPYLLIGEDQVFDGSADCMDLSEATIEVHVWSRSLRGFVECKQIVAVLRGALPQYATIETLRPEAPLITAPALTNDPSSPVVGTARAGYNVEIGEDADKPALPAYRLMEVHPIGSRYLRDPDGITRHAIVTWGAQIEKMES